MTRQSKQVILFIVEGASEEKAFAMLFKNLLENDEVTFHVVKGDITSRKGISAQNIKQKIGRLIDEDCAKTKFQRGDFKEIIQLTDTDGTFIDDADVADGGGTENIYEPTCIRAKNREDIIARNKQKSTILKLLSTTKKIWGGIPYRIYFMSCNTDHILHNNPNLEKKDKCRYADRFWRTYCQKPEKFLDFIDSDDFAARQNYEQSWNEIQRGSNSLQRRTNFNLYWKP